MDVCPAFKNAITSRKRSCPGIAIKVITLALLACGLSEYGTIFIDVVICLTICAIPFPQYKSQGVVQSQLLVVGDDPNGIPDLCKYVEMRLA